MPRLKLFKTMAVKDFLTPLQLEAYGDSANAVSYGDAVATLIRPFEILNFLDAQRDDLEAQMRAHCGPVDPEAEAEYATLVADLTQVNKAITKVRAVPKNVLLNLGG